MRNSCDSIQSRGHRWNIFGGSGEQARARWALALAASLFFAAAAHAEPQVAHDRLDKAFVAIDQAIAASSVPGLVVGITDRQGTRKVIVHGYADLKTKTRLTPDSLFAIGSMSKSFTAVALMQLVDEGRFDPKEPISRYLPWFKVNSSFPPITGHHLLSHTAGLPNYLADLSSSRYAAFALRDFEPSYAPGEHYWYSNTGFQILGYALESIEHTPYHTLIERRVLKPLGMTSTVAVIDDLHRASMPVSYVQWPYDEKFVESPWFEYSAADGSILSTAADMCAYVRFLLNRGATPNGRLLSDKAFEMLTTPNLEEYAYGLRVHHAEGIKYVGHGGSIAGFNSLMEADVDDGFAVVFLSNGSLDRALDSWIMKTLKAAYRREPFADPPPPAGTSDVPEATLYANVYRGADGQNLEFVAVDRNLVLKKGAAAVRLARMDVDTFRTPTDDADSFPYVFAREGGHGSARIVGVSHGADSYSLKSQVGTPAIATPAEYLAYVGHYENHNPEGPSVRIFVRNGQLMTLLKGEVPEAGDEALQSLGQGVFRPIRPAYNPERYRFDTIIDGQALRLIITGTPLYRVDTP